MSDGQIAVYLLLGWWVVTPLLIYTIRAIVYVLRRK